MASMILQTWQLFVVVLARRMNQQQQDAVAYLREENRVLREQLGGKRIRFTDDQRRHLAARDRHVISASWFPRDLAGGPAAAVAGPLPH